MTGQQRSALKAAIDAKKREVVKDPGCGSGSVQRYWSGCRCIACRDAQADYKRSRRSVTARPCLGCGKPVNPRLASSEPRCIGCSNRAKVAA